MGQKESNLTIHLEIYAPMVAAAGSLLEMKALALPMVLPLDENGWTGEYTPRQLLKVLGLARSKAQEKKLLAVLEGWQAAGRLKAAGNRYQFGWVKNPRVGDGIPASGERIPAKVGTESPKRGNFPTSKDESQPASLNQNQNLSESKESVDRSGLLRGIGVGENNLHLADSWSLEDVRVLVERVRGDGRIVNKPAYVVASLRGGKTDDDFESVRKAFEQHIGAITPLLYEGIKAALKKYPVQWVLDAIEEGKHTSWQYVEKILVRWMNQGKKPLTPAIEEAPVPTEEQKWSLIHALRRMENPA